MFKEKMNKDSIEKQFNHFYNWFNSNKFILIVFFIYFSILNFYLLKDYVIWRDVARPLLYINDSKSILDLFNIIRYEGSPMLYHSLLWVISKLTTLTPLTAKIFHYLIHTTILFTVLFTLRIPNIFKLLILLQIPNIVYVLYIRQYSISILLILLFAHFYSNKKYFLSCTCLFFLTQTVIHGCFISAVLLLFMMLENYRENKKIFNASYVLVILGMILCYIQFIPPDDLIHGLKKWRPLFSTDNLFFISPFLIDVFFNNVMITIGFLTILYWILREGLYHNKSQTNNILLCIIVLFLGFYLLGAFKYSFNRHHWLLSYALIAFMMIIYKSNETLIVGDLNKRIFILMVMLFSIGNYSTLYEKYRTILFSNGKAVATFLDKKFPNDLVLGKVEFYIEPVSIYRNKQSAYFSLGRQGFVKYTILNHETVDYTKYKDYRVVLKDSEIVNDLNKTPENILNQSPILLLSANEYLNDLKDNLENRIIRGKYKLEFIKSFDGALFENYKVYKINKVTN